MESKILDYLKVTPDQKSRLSDKTKQFVKLLDGLQMVYYKSPESAKKDKLGLTIVELNNQLMAYLKGEGMGIYSISVPITAPPAVVTTPPPVTISQQPQIQTQAAQPQAPQPTQSTPQEQRPQPQQEPQKMTLEQMIQELAKAIKGLEILAKSGNSDAKKAVGGLKILKSRYEQQVASQNEQPQSVEPQLEEQEPQPVTQMPSVVPISQEVTNFIEKLNQQYGNENTEYSGEKGSSYYKIIYKSYGSRSAWGFVALKDNPKKGERVGDLLKAASWNAPAKIPRGNILEGTAKYDKYSPSYLK